MKSYKRTIILSEFVFILRSPNGSVEYVFYFTYRFLCWGSLVVLWFIRGPLFLFLLNRLLLWFEKLLLLLHLRFDVSTVLKLSFTGWISSN